MLHLKFLKLLSFSLRADFFSYLHFKLEKRITSLRKASKRRSNSFIPKTKDDVFIGRAVKSPLRVWIYIIQEIYFVYKASAKTKREKFNV